MSIKLTSAAWDVSLPSYEKKFVLLALCDGANDAGECFTSVASLAEKCCLSESVVAGVLLSLVDDGLVLQVSHSPINGQYFPGSDMLCRLRVPVRVGGAA